MNYKSLKEAAEIFNLTGPVSLKEIKKRHRELVKEYHPDSGNQPDTEFIKEINSSYVILLAYCETFRFSFSKDEFYKQHPEEHLIEQFMDDPIWGNGRKNET